MRFASPDRTAMRQPVYSGFRSPDDTIVPRAGLVPRRGRPVMPPVSALTAMTAPDAQFSAALLALPPRLRRYARMLARDTATADDLVQDTLERAWSHHHQWLPGSDLRAWLFSILHNRRIDLLRASQRLQSLDDDDAPVNLEQLAATAPPADDRLGAIDLQRAFERLSEEHREVLVLVAVEQLSYEETARTLGVPIGTVMSRLSRARQRLRVELSADDPPAAARLTRVK